MRFGIIVFPGSNCDLDCYHVAREVVGSDAELIWHTQTDIRDIDCVILPGGFSYGDYLRAGAIASFSPIMKAVKRFSEAGGIIIGICNGFQILLEAGLLPGVMMWNRRLRFICRPVFVRVENNRTIFTRGYKQGEVLSMPVAHFQGNYFAKKKLLNELINNKQVLFRYCSEDGRIDEGSNPNGSVDNIAGIMNRQGNVLGMMPHPERCAEDLLGSIDGRRLFESIVEQASITRKVS